MTIYVAAGPREPRLEKVDRQAYDVYGASGQKAGHLVRGGRRIWTLTLRAAPPEIFVQFSDAKAEALERAKRY